MRADVRRRAVWRLALRKRASGSVIEQSVEVITTVSSVLSASGIAVAPVVPQQVTALQARRALRAAGLYETVKMAVDAAADPDVQDSWQYCGCLAS